MASNPVFNRIDKQIAQGDYAGFDRGPAASGMSAGSGVRTASTPPAPGPV